jgi:hypothetical protein
MKASPNLRRLTWGCAGFLLALALLALIVGLFIWWMPSRVVGPTVAIRQPASGSRVSMEDGTLLVIRIRGTEAAVRVELWVDGEREATLLPGEGQQVLPEMVRLRWQPSSEGPHTLVAGAYDRRGAQGRSRPVIIDGVADDDPALVGIPLAVEPGDSEDTLAERSGLPAESLEDAVPLAGADGGEIVVQIPAGDLPAGFFGEGGDEPEASRDAPIPEALPQPADLPAAPLSLTAEHAGGCQVRLTWDLGESSANVRLDRLGGLDQDFRHVFEGASAPSEFVDTVPWGGEYIYQIASLGRQGEAPGPMRSVEIPAEACPQAQALPESGAAWFQFEATRLMTAADVERAYCYLSLDGGEYQRIPAGKDVFLPSLGDGWDLAPYLAGMQRRVFQHRVEDPISVAMECWGWQGGDLSLLGVIEDQYPGSEWNVELTGIGSGLEMLFRLSSYFNDLPVLVPVDYSTASPPVPTNVHMARSLSDCLSHAFRPGGRELYPAEALLTMWGCRELDNMLVWDWDPGEGNTQGDLSTFEVVVSGPGDTESLEVGSVTQAAPVPWPSCLEENEAYVSAHADEGIWSGWSDPYAYEQPDCPEFAQVEITLQSLRVSRLDDGCLLFCGGETLQAYGSGEWLVRDTNGEEGGQYATTTLAWMTFWTDGCHGAGIGSGCLFNPRRIRNTTYDLASEDISTSQGGSRSEFGPGNNTVRLTVYDGAAIEFHFELWDSDDVEDDIWCGTIEDMGYFDYLAHAGGQGYETAPLVIGPYSLEDWAHFAYADIAFPWSNTDYDALSDQDSHCTLTYSVQPLGLMYRWR